MGSSIFVRPVQPEKALQPMEVTEFGMLMLVKPLHPENAASPILVTEFGIVVFLHPSVRVLVEVSIIALQLSRESNVLLSLSQNN